MVERRKTGQTALFQILAWGKLFPGRLSKDYHAKVLNLDEKPWKFIISTVAETSGV